MGNDKEKKLQELWEMHSKLYKEKEDVSIEQIPNGAQYIEFYSFDDTTKSVFIAYWSENEVKFIGDTSRIERFNQYGIDNFDKSLDESIVYPHHGEIFLQQLLVNFRSPTFMPSKIKVKK